VTAPVSRKSTASIGGAALGGSAGALVAELLGQLSTFHNSDPNVLRALGSLIVVGLGAYGARAMSWAVKESQDFIEYAAGQAGKVLVDAGNHGVVPQVDVAPLEAKIDVLATALNKHLDTDAEKLLTSIFGTQQAAQHVVSTGTVAEPVEPEPAPPAPLAPAPADDNDPVLDDAYQPAATTDPVLAD
jgi:hypothetical protein